MPPGRTASPKVVLPAAALVAGALLATFALRNPSGAERAELEAEPGAEVLLRVSSVPSGCDVSLDGHRRGTTPAVFEVRRGFEAQELALRCSGHRTHRREVVPDRDQHLDVELAAERDELSPAPVISMHPQVAREAPMQNVPVDIRHPARITVVSAPPGADVFWDGAPVGKAPLTFRRARDGAVHALTVELEGAPPQTRHVRTTLDQVIERFEL